MHHVDVIVPHFNRYPLVQNCIESIIRQQNVHLHIYIIDDHSTKIQASLLKQYCKQLIQEKTVDIHHILLNKNRGPSFCRNYGASICKSPYLAFLDSDDQWQEKKLIKQIQFLMNNPNIHYVHTDEQWIKNNIPIKSLTKHQKQGGFFIKRLLKRCLISPSSILFQKSFWNTLSMHFNPVFRVAEDYEFWLRLNLFYPAGYIDEKLTTKYAGNWEQLSQTKNIDHKRVLALHRLYKFYAKYRQFQNIKLEWYQEIIYKLNILIKGSRKYQKITQTNRYLAWKNVFYRIAEKENILRKNIL